MPASSIRVGRLPVRRLPPRVLLAGALLAWGLGEAIGLGGSWPLGARIALVVVTLAPIAVIDRWPWAVVAILLAGTAVEIRADALGLSVSPMQGIVIAGWVAGATVRDRRRSIAALVGVTVVALAATATLSAFGTAVACLLGWAGARATQAARARRSEALGVLRTARHSSAELRRSEVDAERRRMARELDVAILRAARRIGAEARRAELLLNRDLAAAAVALRSIAATVRAAMEQMRQALTVLRPDGDDGGSPQPDGLATAIAGLRGHGVRVFVHDRGDADDPATVLATARTLEIVARSGWRPPRIDLRRTEHAVWIRIRGRGPVTADERLALARCAERARLHSGTVHVRRRPRPADPRARTTIVHLPVLSRAPRHGPGPAGVVAGVIAATATAADVLTGHSLPVPPGADPTAAQIVAASGLTGIAMTAAWTRRTGPLALLALIAFARSWILGFVGLDATTLPLLAFVAFVTPLWIRDPRRQAVVVGALFTAGLAIIGWAWADATNGSDVVILAMSLAVPWVIAIAVRDAADEASRLTVLRWARARDDLIAAQRAVDDERRRIARDLHDLVGHGLSLVSVQAWGAERALPDHVDRAREGVVAIQRVVASAVGELERLTAPWEAEHDAPAGGSDGHGTAVVAPPGVRAPRVGGSVEDRPAVADVIAEARRSGLPVTLDADDEADRPWPAPVATAVRRVVQESLTNVVRHAGPVETTVRLRVDEHAVDLRITNRISGSAVPSSPSGPSGGLGLVGMRERIESLGGVFAAGVQHERFVVAARVPLAGARTIDTV